MNANILAANLFPLLFPWRQRRLADRLGGEAARQCRADLWRRICQRSRSMGVPEIRGYARAQAADLLAAEVERVLDRHHLGQTFKKRVLTAAVDQLVGMAVRDALSEPSSADAEKIAA